jgi:hypothetical protein
VCCLIVAPTGGIQTPHVQHLSRLIPSLRLFPPSSSIKLNLELSLGTNNFSYHEMLVLGETVAGRDHH